MINNRLFRSFIVFFAASAIVLLVLIVGDVEVRQAIKQRLIYLDASYSGAFLRRVYLNQSLPTNITSEWKHIKQAYSWIDNSFMSIAHALGPIMYGGGNSLVTLQRGLDMGFKIFEVDLALTIDDRLICYHGESNEELANITNLKYLEVIRKEGIEPCYFADLVQFARDHPDVRFVLDVKNRFDNVYQIIRSSIGSPVLGQSFIPQIYFFNQIDIVRQDHFFAGEIFTSYLSALSNQQILETARRLDIKVVTLTKKRFDELGIVPTDLFILTHSIDDPLIAVNVRDLGAKGIYTRYLSPKMFHDVSATVLHH